MRSQALAVEVATEAPEVIELLDLPPARVAMYGGMVGEMLKQIEDRMTHTTPALALDRPVTVRFDPIHVLSVASGYVGLASGLGIAALLLSWAF